MIPNEKYGIYFAERIPEELLVEPKRSSCLHIGSYLVIRKIIAEYHLDQIIEEIIGKDAGLFMDLAAYAIITENNAAQHYESYGFNHPLFTNNMRVYSDSKVSDFLNKLEIDQQIEFQHIWNASKDSLLQGQRNHCKESVVSDRYKEQIFPCVLQRPESNNGTGRTGTED